MQHDIDEWPTGIDVGCCSEVNSCSILLLRRLHCHVFKRIYVVQVVHVSPHIHTAYQYSPFLLMPPASWPCQILARISLPELKGHGRMSRVRLRCHWPLHSSVADGVQASAWGLQATSSPPPRLLPMTAVYGPRRVAVRGMVSTALHRAMPNCRSAEQKVPFFAVSSRCFSPVRMRLPLLQWPLQFHCQLSRCHCPARST
jgi:hypothetical protein